jgi:hypothetical protein
MIITIYSIIQFYYLTRDKAVTRQIKNCWGLLLQKLNYTINNFILININDISDITISYTSTCIPGL